MVRRKCNSTSSQHASVVEVTNTVAAAAWSLPHGPLNMAMESSYGFASSPPCVPTALFTPVRIGVVSRFAIPPLIQFPDSDIGFSATEKLVEYEREPTSF